MAWPCLSHRIPRLLTQPHPNPTLKAQPRLIFLRLVFPQGQRLIDEWQQGSGIPQAAVSASLPRPCTPSSLPQDEPAWPQQSPNPDAHRRSYESPPAPAFQRHAASVAVSPRAAVSDWASPPGKNHSRSVGARPGGSVVSQDQVRGAMHVCDVLCGVLLVRVLFGNP